MQNSNSENVLSGVPIETAKPKQVRTKRAIWRYNDDGTYDKKPLVENYFNDYYHKKLGIKVVCEFCGSTVNKQKLKCEHQLSKNV
jgi:hypothetical protein